MTPSEQQSQKEHWREFAREDPMFYIACAPKGTSPEEFFAAGKDLSDWVLEWLGTENTGGKMLEIGCGLGRMLHHFAPSFEHVDGIDIADEMVEGAKEHGLPDNADATVGSGADLSPFADDRFDFVYSFQVFQHIRDADAIETYLREVARVLRPGGRAVLQYDTRPEGLAYRLYFALPEQLRRRAHKGYIRRYRRDPEWLRQTMAACSLEVLDEKWPVSADHFFLLKN